LRVERGAAEKRTEIKVTTTVETKRGALEWKKQPDANILLESAAFLPRDFVMRSTPPLRHSNTSKHLQ
jgi:hypothetical protein